MIDRRTLFLAAVAVAITAASTPGQLSAPSRISWYLAVPGAERLSEPPRTHRLYQEPQEFVIAIAIQNESDEALLVDSGTLQSRVHLRISSDTEQIRTQFAWSPFIRRSGISAELYVADSVVRLESGEAVTWEVSVQRDDGVAFSAGAYHAQVVMRETVGAFRTDTGAAWAGWLLPETDVTIVLGRALGARERAREARVAGNLARSQNRLVDAAAAFEREVIADPASDGARWNLATTYLALGRYRDAAILLEQVLPRMGGHPRVAVALAQAYLGDGDDGNAIRVLQGSGLSGEQLARELADQRRIVRQRR